MNGPARTDIYVVRHAHVHNPNDILYGRLPRFRLSELGWKQAQKLAAFLSGRSIETIYSSPLLRARQTAEVIAQSLPGVPVRQSKLILEVRTGYEGKPNSIMKPGFSFYEPMVAESDESMEVVYERLSRFLQRLVVRHAGQSVVVVTHADPIAIMRLGLLHLPLTVSSLHATVYPARATINLVTLTPDRKPVITYFNVSGERN